MNILVIGGTGVLGNELVASLSSAGHKTWVLSNGLGPMSLAAGAGGHLIGDRNDESALVAALASAPIQQWDCIVDSACYEASQVELLVRAIAGRSLRYIVISTTFVYRPSAPALLREDSPTGSAKQLGGYAANKLLAEAAWHATGSSMTILRLPHVLAPGCLPGVVPLHNRDSQLITRLRNGWPVWLVDEGRQQMQFIDGADVGRAVTRLVEWRGAGVRTYNCAYSEPTTGRTYIEALATTLGVIPIFLDVPAHMHRASGWGWELSTISRICDTHALDQEIGRAPTSLMASIQRCLPGWVDASCSMQTDPLAGLNDCSDDTSLLNELRRLARSRVPSALDKRMNQGAPPALSL